jgi:acyl-CoA thioesterase FadM
MTVRCWIVHFTDTGCRVAFEIEKNPTGKRVCDGFCDYTLVTLANGRATAIPEDVRAKYSI